jgi:hypothetical protein
MHAPIFQDPKKIQFRQKHLEYKEVIKGVVKHICYPNDIKGINKQMIYSTNEPNNILSMKE